MLTKRLEKRQLHKNAASNIEQVLQAAPHKAAAIRPPTTHHEKYPDMQDTTGEVGTSSLVMYSYGPLHMAEQKQSDQLEPTYCASMRIRSVAMRTNRNPWTIGRGGEIGSGISVLMARQDDEIMSKLI